MKGNINNQVVRGQTESDNCYDTAGQSHNEITMNKVLFIARTLGTVWCCYKPFSRRLGLDKEDSSEMICLQSKDCVLSAENNFHCSPIIVSLATSQLLLNNRINKMGDKRGQHQR